MVLVRRRCPVAAIAVAVVFAVQDDAGLLALIPIGVVVVEVGQTLHGDPGSRVAQGGDLRDGSLLLLCSQKI